MVLYNGAVTVKPDGRTVVAVSRLPAGARERIVTGAVHLTSVRGVVLHGVQETTVDRRSEGFDAFIERSRIGPTRVDPKLGALTEGEPVKVLLFVAEDGIEGVRDTLRESVAAARVLVTSNETVEVVASGVTKAKAIRAIVAERDIAPADVLTFGDSGNDVEMLSELGPGLAMANCRPEACGAALARIGSHDTDTIAAALRKLATTPACGGEGGREQSGPASVSEAERP